MGALRVYFDSSVLVSLITTDMFSVRADQAFRGRGITPFVSDFATAEFASAISRRVRMKLFAADEARAAFSNFDAWMAGAISRIETTPTDIRAAEAALRRLDLTLRAPDAIHIAIAGRIGAELATFDAKMAESARVLGAQIFAI
jgi:hypothetical protein